ncbi:MAG: hypothetical protein HKN87_13925 [Saprospiraceae bacterium]|nr:hypothetical protein [Saprospiraceae bacterium]
MKNIITLVLIFCSAGIQAQDLNSQPLVGISSEYSSRMLDQNQNLRKVLILLEDRKSGILPQKGFIFGSSLIALVDFQQSNTDSKFGYLMRHPTASNQIGKTVSEAVLHSFQVATTTNINNWLTAYTEILYNPQQSFGQGSITDLERNQLQLRRGLVVVGDLNRSPFYGAIGKMDAPFGLTGSVSPFTNSSMWHAFGGLGYGAQVGFRGPSLSGTFMAVQGGSQFRALNTPVADSTNVPSRLNNFVFDINYRTAFAPEVKLLFGASYLHGSAYCQDFPVVHFEPCKKRNPAVTVYSELHVGRKLLIKAAHAITSREWPGTENPNPPLDIYEARKVSSLSLGGQYKFDNTGLVQYIVSAEFSNFRAGSDDAPWERQNQLVFGGSALIQGSTKLFVEIFRTAGYVPLNWISGSHPFNPFPPGQTHSERDARSTGLVVGAQLTL